MTSGLPRTPGPAVTGTRGARRPSGPSSSGASPLGLSSLLAGLLLLLGFASTASAQGIEVKRDGIVLSGSPANCTQPATIRFDDVRRVTPEWKTIRREGVRKGSARYSLLLSEMNARIKRLCRQIGTDLGKDCILRDGDIQNDNGLTVADVTSDLVRAVESDTVAL